jgi:hypothetical protein
MRMEVEVSDDPTTTGEIFIAPNFTLGECTQPVCRGEKYEELIPTAWSSNSEGALGGTGERAVDLGDKLFISGGYRDKFLYLYGSQISVRPHSFKSIQFF